MGRCWLGIIGQTAAYHAGPVWEQVAIEALQDPAVPVKIDSVKSLSQYGSRAAKPAIFDAFRYWHEWWKNRGEQNDESRGLEQTFVAAAAHPKSWAPDDRDLAIIRDLRLPEGCRSQVPQHYN
jgi:hypothetical protein